MTLVCFASFKGAPGVTTTALATAAAWPSRAGRQKLFVEADAEGGAVALRYRRPTRPGLSSLAAAASSGLDRRRLLDHAQILPGGLPVVPAPHGPEQASAALEVLGDQLGRLLAGEPDIDAIADLGRLSASSPAQQLARSAVAILVVARPVATQLEPSAQRMTSLSGLGAEVGWVLIGDRPYTAEQVAAAYGFPVVRVLPFDQRAATALETGTNPGRVRRSGLARDIANLAESIAGWVQSRAPGFERPALDAGRSNLLPGEPAESPPASGPGRSEHEISPAMRAALQSFPEQ